MDHLDLANAVNREEPYTTNAFSSGQESNLQLFASSVEVLIPPLSLSRPLLELLQMKTATSIWGLQLVYLRKEMIRRTIWDREEVTVLPLQHATMHQLTVVRAYTDEGNCWTPMRGRNRSEDAVEKSR